MNHINIAIELTRNKEVFRNMLHGVDDAQLRWKPAPGKWCMLEVICHLYDEETKDFRVRMDHVLNNTILPLEPLDPVGWVTSGNYMQQDADMVLQNFLVERGRSTEYLNALVAPAWHNQYNHPEYGPMTAGMFLINWLAHDYHHIRQVNELKYLYFKEISGMPLDYAGNW